MALGSDRLTVAGELLAIRDAIMGDINTQLQGTYLFGGSNVLTTPYAIVGGNISAYQGDSAAVRNDIAAGRDVAGTFDGAGLRGDEPSPPGDRSRALL